MFTETERRSLTKLLSKAVNADDALNMEELHGFLFGLSTIPELIPPSEWLPMVFGEEMMEFESDSEAQEMMGSLFKICNRFYKESHRGTLRFPFDPASLKEGDVARMGDWAYGLFLAIRLRPGTWDFGLELDEDSVSEDVEELTSACGIIMGVAMPELIPEIFEKEDFDPETNEKDLELQATLFALLPQAVATVQEHARLKTKEYLDSIKAARESAGHKREKIGRNAPCPCGSGRKYKKCCGRN